MLQSVGDASSSAMVVHHYLHTLILLALVALAYQDEAFPVVKTLSGNVRGNYRLSYGGRRYEAFEGIPYAEPPLGALRFKPPVPISPWTGVLPATIVNDGCMQFARSAVREKYEVLGSENCLHLHVYTPRNSLDVWSNRSLPVFFYIHGGAFQFGNANDGPKYFMDRNVVVVNVQYRLGPFGFLSTGDDVVPGNMGLMDQNMALRWVSDNIKYFGGDPQRITLIGLSAGGASVHYHYLSPLSAGLFRNGISMSGTAFDCWAFTDNAAVKAKQLGAMLGCPTEDTARMVSCLQTRPPYAISDAVGAFLVFLYNPFTPFGPVVEKGGNAPFMDRSPAEIISSGDVYDAPWITGVVSEEGLYPAAEFIASEARLKQLDGMWDEIGPHYLDFNSTLPQKEHVKVARLIKKHYLGNRKISSATVKPFLYMTGDRMFVFDSQKAAKMQATVNKSPVRYYHYAYRANQSLSDDMSGTNINFGVSHADDLFIMFDTRYIDPTRKKSDFAMQQKLLDIYVSFATDGEPRVDGLTWKTVKPNTNKLNFLQIDSARNIHMRSDNNLGERKFWESIDFDENRVPSEYKVQMN